MLSGSAIVRVSVLLVVAGLLAALAQFLWLRGGADTAAEVPTIAAPPQERAVEPDPPGPAPEPAPDLRAAPASPPTRAAPEPAVAPPRAAEAPAAASPPPQDPALPEQARADPPAVALLDLNTATLAQLNGLKGGGNIGRAIIQKRPYAAVDQLLAKRVLSRATYERIKDQVTVQ